MKFFKIVVSIWLLLFSVFLPAAAYRFGLDAGLDNGTGFTLSAAVRNFLPGSRLEMRGVFGLSWSDPGNALMARKIFINDGTNGFPEKKGKNVNFRVDVTFPSKLKLLPNPRIYLGVRYTRFTGSFRYVGGNEEFDITGDPWGVGGGVETYFPMNKKYNFHITAGLDYFFPSHLHGHDTTYYPDNLNVNARKNYTYSDADSAIRQPRFEFRLMAGISTRR